MNLRARLRFFLARRFGVGCDHQWGNTGDSYTDSQHGFTVVIKECRDCGLVIVIEV